MVTTFLNIFSRQHIPRYDYRENTSILDTKNTYNDRYVPNIAYSPIGDGRVSNKRIGELTNNSIIIPPNETLITFCYHSVTYKINKHT